MLREITQTQKDKNVWHHLLVESRKNKQTRVYNKKRNRHRYREKKLVASSLFERDDTGVGDWEPQTTGCDLAQGDIIQHRHYSQYFVITVNGK